jgi:hypothetical protein
MSDRRWDFKFLGMQILIEGLALGAFGTLRAATREPLLKEVLKYVITDEALRPLRGRRPARVLRRAR